MLARIRTGANGRLQHEREGGFTLIELLVVIIIIGILAAIAIPVFLNQRKKAVDTSMKSDLRTIANEEETYFTDYQSYAATGGPANPVLVGQAPNPITSVKLSTGNQAEVFVNTAGDAYCVHITRATGAQPGTQDWTYISNKGGLQPPGAASASCPASF